jgi:hypothetical protein
MTELHDLLDRAAGELPAARMTQLEADVGRGVRALRRRRVGATGGVLTVAVAAALPFAVGNLGRSEGAAVQPAGPTSRTTSQGPTAPDAAAQLAAQQKADAAAQRAAMKAAASAASAGGSKGRAVDLVAYTGTQPAGGYRVGLIPKGWMVQGGAPTYLTIAAAKARDTDPTVFVGKLVAFLDTADQVPGTIDPSLSPGSIGSAQDHETLRLFLRLATPQHGADWLEVQVPRTLGWSTAVARRFVTSVAVLPQAAPGLG